MSLTHTMFGCGASALLAGYFHDYGSNGLCLGFAAIAALFLAASFFKYLGKHDS